MQLFSWNCCTYYSYTSCAPRVPTGRPCSVNLAHPFGCTLFRLLKTGRHPKRRKGCVLHSHQCCLTCLCAHTCSHVRRLWPFLTRITKHRCCVRRDKRWHAFVYQVFKTDIWQNIARNMRFPGYVSSSTVHFHRPLPTTSYHAMLCQVILLPVYSNQWIFCVCLQPRGRRTTGLQWSKENADAFVFPPALSLLLSFNVFGFLCCPCVNHTVYCLGARAGPLRTQMAWDNSPSNDEDRVKSRMVRMRITTLNA